VTAEHAVATDLTVEIDLPPKAFWTIYVFVLRVKHFLSELLLSPGKFHQRSLLSTKLKSDVEQSMWQIPAQNKNVQVSRQTERAKPEKSWIVCSRKDKPVDNAGLVFLP